MARRLKSVPTDRHALTTEAERAERRAVLFAQRAKLALRTSAKWRKRADYLHDRLDAMPGAEVTTLEEMLVALRKRGCGRCGTEVKKDDAVTMRDDRLVHRECPKARGKLRAIDVVGGAT